MMNQLIEICGDKLMITTIEESCTLHARIGWQGLTKKEYLDEGDYYLITGVDFDQGHIDFENCHFVTKDRYDQDEHIQIDVDDILVTKDGTIGKVAIVDEPLDKPATLNSGVFVVRPREKNALLPRYLMYVLQSNHFNSFIDRIKVGCTIAHLNQEKFLKYDFPLPPVGEQKKIINIFDVMCSALRKRQNELSKLDELIQARFVEVFGDPETNPKGWEKVTLNDVCSSIVRGPFGSALKKEFFVEPDDSTYKVYEQKHAIQKSATIGTYYITEEKYQELKRFECVAGDILMSCSGTMGELYQLPEDCERGIINQALCKFSLNDKILPICFLTYMRQTIGNLETKGSGIKNIAAVSFVKQMPINLPPMEVQKEFEEFCKQVDKSKVQVQEALERTQLLFDCLMQKYFGG